MSKVPCDGCTACCRDQIVVIMPEDEHNLAAYDTRPFGTLKVLNARLNGDCVHATEDGCAIYDQRPAVCRAYDCRKQFRIMSRNERRQLKNKQIWTEARKRLKTLDQDDMADIGRYAFEALRKMDAILS